MTIMDHKYRFDSTPLQIPRHLEAELSHLAALERWIEEIAMQISATRGIDSQSALDGARLATMWLDDYKAIQATHVTTMWSRQFQAPLELQGACPKAAIDASFDLALARATHVRGIEGGQVLQAIITAARIAFCEGFDAPTIDVWTLITTEEA